MAKETARLFKYRTSYGYTTICSFLNDSKHSLEEFIKDTDSSMKAILDVGDILVAKPKILEIDFEDLTQEEIHLSEIQALQDLIDKEQDIFINKITPLKEKLQELLALEG